MLLFLRDVTYAAATGSLETPQWPELSWPAMFGNFARMLVLASVAWLPAILVHDPLYLLGAKRAATVAGLVVMVAGMYFFPMMFLYHVMTRNLLAAFRPRVILDNIRKAGPGYRRAALIWQAAAVVMVAMGRVIGLEHGYLLGPVVAAAAVYLLMLAGRALGLVFQAHREKLDWMG
jgi:hypothetical protein